MKTVLQRPNVSRIKLPTKTWIGSLSLLTIAIVSTYMWMTYQDKSTNYQTAKVSLSDITSSMSVSGQVDSKDTITVRTTGGGKITDVLVQPGTEVKAGTILVKLDGNSIAEKNYDAMKKKLDYSKKSVDLAQQKIDADKQMAGSKSDISQDEAIVNVAQIQLNNAKQMLNDATEEYTQYQQQMAEKSSGQQTANGQPGASAEGQGDLSKQGLDQLKNTLDQEKGQEQVAEANLRQAQAKLAADQSPQDERVISTDEQALVQVQQAVVDAQLDLDKAKIALDQTEVTAPEDGVIASVSKNVGDLLAPQDDVCVLVSNQSKHQVIGLVPADEVSSVKIGSHAVIESNQFSGEMSGSVYYISPVPKVEQNSSLYEYEVYIRVEHMPEQVLSGMAVKINIETETLKHVPTVPVEAIMDENGKQGLYVQSGGENNYVFKPIKIGASDDKKVEVKGIIEGTVISLQKPVGK